VFSRFIRRDLRRAALLRWMTPLRTATSSAEIAALTASCDSVGLSAMAVRAFFTKVRVADRTA
jgi:hypothetical protein